MNTNVGLNVFATQVVLKQRMILPREPFLEMYAATWEIAGVGTVGTNNLTAIAESICQLIHQFSHDYLMMNPGTYFGAVSSITAPHIQAPGVPKQSVQ